MKNQPLSVKRQVTQKIVVQYKARAYRKLKKQEDTMIQMKRKIESLKKKLKRREPIPTTRNSKVDALIVPSELSRKLLFSEVMSERNIL